MGEKEYKTYIQLHSVMNDTGLHQAHGLFNTLEAALGRAFLDAQKYIDDQDGTDSEKENRYLLSLLYYLEGGSDMAFELLNKETNKTEITYYFLEYLEEVENKYGYH